MWHIVRGPAGEVGIPFPRKAAIVVTNSFQIKQVFRYFENLDEESACMSVTWDPTEWTFRTLIIWILMQRNLEECLGSLQG